MKIAYLSSINIPSRTANSIHVMKMCQAFSENGHEILLFAKVTKKHKKRHIIYESYNIRNHFKIKSYPFSNIKYAGHIYGIFIAIEAKKFGADMVIGRHPTGCYFSTFIRIKNNIRNSLAHKRIWISYSLFF